MAIPAVVSLRIYIHGEEIKGLHVTVAKVELSPPADQWSVLKALVEKFGKYFGRGMVYEVKGTPRQWGQNSFYIDFHNDSVDSVDVIRRQMFNALEQMRLVKIDKTRYPDGIPPQHVDTRGVFPRFTTGVTFAIVVQPLRR